MLQTGLEELLFHEGNVWMSLIHSFKHLHSFKLEILVLDAATENNDYTCNCNTLGKLNYLVETIPMVRNAFWEKTPVASVFRPVKPSVPASRTDLNTDTDLFLIFCCLIVLPPDEIGGHPLPPGPGVHPHHADAEELAGAQLVVDVGVLSAQCVMNRHHRLPLGVDHVLQPLLQVVKELGSEVGVVDAHADHLTGRVVGKSVKNETQCNELFLLKIALNSQ